MATIGGLFIPGLYRFPAWLVTATQGQDLVTLAIALPAMAQAFDTTVPRRAVALFLAFMSLMLIVQWLARIIPNLTVYPVPESIEPLQFVYAMDLGLIVPLMLLFAVWIWQGRPWGYLLSGAMLIKAATMGLALLGMTLFNWIASPSTRLT